MKGILKLLQEMKRWTGSKMGGYLKNSLFDYILFDSIRDTEKLKEFLTDPFKYQGKKHGSNKLGEVLDFIQTRPDLFYIITESYPQGAI